MSQLNADEEEDEVFLNSEKVVAIVNLLNKFKVKLWEMPDLNEDANAEELQMRLSDESGFMECEIATILARLQKHSRAKLESNKRFRQNGVACFKLKVIGNHNKIKPKSFSANIETRIDQTGNELKEFIMNELGLDCTSLKMINNGKMIREEALLSGQAIKNYATIMVMCVYKEKLTEMANSAAELKIVSDIKEAVFLLNSEKLKLGGVNGRAEFNVKNQNGISLDIERADEDSLTVAMVLHEKAKTMILKKDYLKALILLAEADNEFKNCGDTSLLDRVDNYALLNLDTIWCYLNLENLHELKDAEDRLASTEKCLLKCYGADLQRLSLIKTQCASKHLPIYVRLHLFKAILAYHRGRKSECREHLDLASDKLRQTQIDEDKLVQLMAMGFGSVEARLALRAASNDVSMAMDTIFKKKQRQKEAAQVEMARKLEKEFGRTKSGQSIDLKLLEELNNNGFGRSEAAKALIETGNELESALGLLAIKKEGIERLVAMGYSRKRVKAILESVEGDLLRAVEMLTGNLDVLEVKESHEEGMTSKEAEVKALRICEEMKEEMGRDDEAYLDFDLEEDARFIDKYYDLLRK